ncbi:uncharacterized protein LOC114525101 [Dendronephthya gigantea]|uniref:uncharacterized protein LOC114525101 n=1 Tax=Dendronephthya gigantea TaxID=151771 RepID=UPI00106B48FE|nr:uncharacterized protein LOC114525101 [Dendronephthya gigantea]
MLPRCVHFVTLLAFFLSLQDVACFFVRFWDGHSGVPYCINDTGIIQSNGSWGNLYFLELSGDSCLHLTAQFRFRENGAMLNLNRQGCLAGGSLSGSGFNLDLFYLYVDSVSLDTAACAQNPNKGIYRAINQTTQGALSVYYKGHGKSLFETWCATYEYNYQLSKKYAINQHIGLSTRCDNWNQRFIFGSVTCYGDMVKNANCPKNQYMVVKIASFRGLLATKTCGLILTDYSCELDVTCLVKKKCDGLHECSMLVDNTLFPSDWCPGLKTYLYFEYQCHFNVKPFKELCRFLEEFRPLLAGDRVNFPDSSFSASASTKGHSPSDARMSSGSSWCAPVANDKHYLQVDLDTLYWLFHLITYGDSTSPKWVATYNFNYTLDLVIWRLYRDGVSGNVTNAVAYNKMSLYEPGK